MICLNPTSVLKRASTAPNYQTPPSSIIPPLFDMSKLQELAAARAADYQNAAPFPHIAIDNFANESLLNEALDLFPCLQKFEWFKYDNPLEKKFATNKIETLPEAFQWIFYQFNSAPFLRFLEVMTGVQNLIPDQEFTGGGLHLSKRGGKLDIHADFNIHPKTKLCRRLNAILYMNRDWKEEYGGHLELWDNKMTRAVQRILPVFNRLVVFSTNDDSFHGHPEPMTCPEGVFRKSFALYYYTNGRPESEMSDSHSTLYQKRPQDPDSKELEELRAKRAKGRLADLKTKVV